MNLKTRITTFVASELGLSTDKDSLKKLIRLWWQNPRMKEKGGYRLTREGMTCFMNADLKYHKIRLDEPLAFMTNKCIITLDQSLDYPFFLTHKEVFVFDDRTAIQLILFSGNLIKFTNAKIASLKNA